MTQRSLKQMILLGCLCIGAFSPNIITAQTRTAAAQTYPIISLETELARDANTFETDKSLEQACRSMSADAATCLCVTHVLKFELTLPEYKAAARLYGQSGDRSAAYASLRDQGIEPSDISVAEDMERTLTSDPKFAERCADAKAYYKDAKR